MLKRVKIGGLIALGVVIILILYFLKNDKTFQEASAAEAVPTNAIVYLENIDYEYFTESFQLENQIWRAFSANKKFNTDSIFYEIKSLLLNAPLIEDRLSNEALSLSIHLLGQNKLNVLCYVSLGEKLGSNGIIAELQSLSNEDVILSQRKYEAVDIYDLKFTELQYLKELSFAVKDGLLILSTSSMLVEDAIRSLNSEGGIKSQKAFRKVAETAGKYVYGNLYVNYSKINQLFYPLVQTNKINSLSGIAELALWGEFDIDFRDNLILLNGMSYTEDSLKSWLNLFNGQSSVRLEAPSYVPSNAISFMAAGISDLDLFKEKFKNELIIRDEFQSFALFEDKIEKILGVSPFNSLVDLIDNEIAWFTIEDNNNPREYSEVSILEARSRSEALELLSGWVSILAADINKSDTDYITKYSLDDQTSYAIYTFPQRIFGPPILQRFLKSSFVIFDNYIIFSSSKEALKRTIYQNLLHKTLENEPSHSEVNELISTKANLTMLIRPEYYFGRYSSILKGSVKAAINEMAATIHKIPAIIIQFSNEGDIFYSNISVKYTPILKEKASTVWESLLDTIAITKPYLVSNHYTSEKEIIVQDAMNSLYLINSTGRVLWKLKLDSRILSEIFQVDYYKNGKLQYIFNTKNSMHLIDRNGNYVERFPVKFRSDATNGLQMFDYDKRSEYRIFVACNDRKIYVYNLEGNTVPGWSFKMTEGIVEKPVQHFRILEKDYILFSDNIRSYIVDRRGRERISLKEPYIVSENNMFYLDMNIKGEGPRFVTSDTAGSVIGIDLKGKVDKILERQASSKHYFLMRDLNRDGIPEYIFGDGNELEVIDLTGKRLFSYKLKTDISKLPDIYEFSSSELKIGITDSRKNLIYLINTDGTIYEGFPLEGDTRFSIGYFAGSDSRFNLIVGSQNGFLYNYSIE